MASGINPVPLSALPPYSSEDSSSTLGSSSERLSITPSKFPINVIWEREEGKRAANSDTKGLG